ncbi:carbohydrate binding domain-containing protein [Streptomyces sp. NBC_01723]|uniref:carbohydrate binding domain-containing protein n=1 Tax=Streptomyces sp. NBC_01723 TaxID=2975921 RepID=UPI002E340053|nr:carbohydrate binding domain-containing protein [Streptomyces sp. NBC_01723]
MPQLPPPVWAELFHSGAWSDVTEDVRVTTSPVSVTRGQSSESSSSQPTACTCDLDSRDNLYAPRNPVSPLYGKIGRNTPFRWGYTVGGPWAVLPGNVSWSALFVNEHSQLDVTGDFDLRLDLALENWSQSQMLALRYVTSNGDNRCWALEILDGFPTFLWSPDGTFASRISQAATEQVEAHNGQRLALRVTLVRNNGSGRYELRFYTGRTVDDEDWNLLGAPIIGASTTQVHPGTAYMEFGGGFNFNTDPAGGALSMMRGKAYALKLLDTGTVKVNMSTAVSAQPGGGAFTDSSGLDWNLGGGTTLTNRHIRMSGEVPAWPPTRDLSGQDNYVSIAPSGILRRMGAGTKPQDSALRRFIKTLSPLECWPLTDGPDSKAAKSMVGGRDMVQPYQAGTVAPEWGGGRLADWVEPVIAAKAETIGGLQASVRRVSSVGASWSVDLFLSGGGAPASGQFVITDTGAGTDADNQVNIQIVFSGNLDQLTLIRNSYGSDSSSSSFLANVTGVGIYDERPHHMRLTVEPGATSFWTLYIDGQFKQAGSLTGIRMKPVGRILLGWGFATVSGATATDRSFGYLTYWNSSGPSAARMWDAYMGYQGERAGVRIERLASESGYVATVAGEAVYQQRMGIQDRAQLVDLLEEASRTNFGYLLEARDRAEVIHRGQSTLWNQTPALTLDYAAGLIGAPFKPVDDDKLTENDVSVKRQYGSVPGRQVLETGELSVLDPPNGVGRYDHEYTYSLYNDDQADQVARMRLHLGTYAGVRYTRLTLNLANDRVFAMIDAILRIDVGDKIRLTNLPADHGPDAVDVLVQGYEETAGPDGWTITFNCAPGEPWTTGNASDYRRGHADTGGSQLTAGINATATSVQLTNTGERAWTSDPFDMPFDLRVGGEVLTVTAPGALVNRAANPFTDTNATGWSAESGAASSSTAVVHPDPHARGSLLLTPAGGAAFAGLLGDLSGVGTVTPGASYIISAWVYSRNGWSDVRPSIYWYDSGGGFLSTSAAGALAVPAGQWTFLQETFTAPASASQAKARLRHGNTPAATDLLYAWAVRITSATAGTGPQTFTVVRSVNGISKSHAAGADVRLAQPNYAAL